MNLDPQLLLFLISVIFISVSGVLMPGPLFAVALAKGHRNKYSGAFLAFGHGLVEIPLMILIYLGFSRFFALNWLSLVISFAGGAMLVYMGVQMFRQRRNSLLPAKDSVYGAVGAGIVTSAANPYFLIWWSTVGAALILSVRKFGLVGFVLFALVHWLCDFFWLLIVSLVTNKSRKLWTPLVQSVVIGSCGCVLSGFGIWFIYSGISKLLAG